MEEFILFILCFLLVFFVYQIFIVKKAKKKNAKKKPMEVNFLINKYKVDLKKANYNQMLQIVALVSSFDIALIVSLACLVDDYLMELLIALISSVPIIFISYYFVGNFYKKKGMIKDE